jgi:rare lipoprotein A (peptidoglycan hydrolase)
MVDSSMKSLRSLAVALAVVAGGVAWRAPAPARAAASGSNDTPAALQQQLDAARLTRAQARTALREAGRRFAGLNAQYRQAQAALEAAAADVVGAEAEQQAVAAQLFAAQTALNAKVRAAYEAGPAAVIELFLGARSPADFASAQEFEARSIAVDEGTVGAVQQANLAAHALAARLQRRQADLRTSARQIQALDAAMADALEQARSVAARAGTAVATLAARQRALEQQQAADNAVLDGLIDPKAGVDQSALLALLGPTHGEGCAIPSGLRDTGQRVSGPASWYGADFAGQATATGAIFDPRLFTAANKELPLNVFLRVRYQDRCAVVLVNDRGPYGYGRRFDLSEAAAAYLGYHSSGVVPVTADVLVPRTP